MSENKINLQSAITTLPYLDWNATSSATLDAVAELEAARCSISLIWPLI
ncbi:Uncharacterised protein [Serratia fonticola]|uniref:Uncharacterized protein n=1 Tax=Serratia fonticola TaxID=47917 RepID=A0A4U9TQH4_SERFO|nr:Uncharacterised protein [Serratia fonticola]